MLVQLDHAGPLDRRGRTFTHAAPPRHLVASVPYRYEPDAGPYGLFQPSNIVRRPEDGYYYALIHAEAFTARSARARA